MEAHDGSHAETLGQRRRHRRNDDDRILVIKRDDNGHWEAPGGVLELGESFEDGVRREVLEGTGLTVSVERSAAYTKTSPTESSP